MSSTFAQQAPLPTRDLQTQASLRQRLGEDIPTMPASEDQFLFFQLPANRSVEGPQQIDFIVHEGSAIYLAERFTLAPVDEHPSPSVQFLSREPAQLKKLVRLAKKGGHRLSLAVMVDGQIIREFPFDEFLAYNKELKQQQDFHPVHINPKVVVFRPKAKTEEGSRLRSEDLTCTQECDLVYEDCAQQECGDPMSICGPCYSQWVECRNACPPPPPPPCTPSSSISIQRFFLGVYYFQPECTWNYSGGNTWHYTKLYIYQENTILHTVGCREDGTTFTSDEVIDTQYIYIIEDVNTGQPC
jgi:hypothetical protein